MDISHLVTILVKTVFYVVIVITAFFSLFGVYLFIRHGENRSFTLVISAAYALTFLIIISIALTTLAQL